jgi:hypothetical protein
MIEPVKYVVEITAGFGWYKDRISERFIVVKDMAGSKGLAPWRLDGPSVLIYDVGQAVSMICTRYIRKDDCKLIED